MCILLGGDGTRDGRVDTWTVVLGGERFFAPTTSGAGSPGYRVFLCHGPDFPGLPPSGRGC